MSLSSIEEGAYHLGYLLLTCLGIYLAHLKYDMISRSVDVYSLSSLLCVSPLS